MIGRLLSRKTSGVMFKYLGVLWEPFIVTEPGTNNSRFEFHMPICPRCRISLQISDAPNKTGCFNCKSSYVFEKTVPDIRQMAHAMYEGKTREDYRVTSLDLPPHAVKSEDEDENYWIEARLGQKDGKKMALVYFGEKKRKSQSKKDYIQFFLDFDDEQLRFDKSNKNPLEIIGKFSAEFLKSVHISEKK